jgi:glycosyltransferase involved in cell wall biosynthesis
LIPERPIVSILHYSAPPIVGGVEQVVAEHVRQLARAGYPVRVVAGRGAAAGLPETVPLYLAPEIDSEHPLNLAVGEALGRGEAPPAFEPLSQRIEAGLAEALAETQVVIAHNVLTMHFNLPLVAALHRLLGRGAATGEGRRLIAWCHDVSRYVRPASSAAQRRGLPWDLLRTHRPEWTYVAVSPERQRQLAEVLGVAAGRIRVVPNGVDSRSLLGLSETGWQLATDFDLLAGGLVALMPVRITRAKNIEFALRLTAELKALGAQPRLVVTGPPDPHSPEAMAYFAELRGLRRELALAAEAFFVYEGTPRTANPLEIEAAVVGELYRLCDLVLMPSHREGFGLPVLEAGLVGRPVFTTPVPAVELVGGDTVFQISPDESAEALARRLWRWAEHDPGLRLRRRVRRDYAWASIFHNQIEPLIAEVVARPLGAPARE